MSPPSTYGNPNVKVKLDYSLPPCQECKQVYMAGVVKSLTEGWLRCWFCAFPDVGKHL